MRNLDIAQLRALLAIVQYDGVGRAAKMLNLTQSAVSMQIKRLEESVGAELFSREGRKLQLTSTGETVQKYARQIIALNDEIVENIAEENDVEEVSFGLPPDLTEHYLAQIVNQFKNLHPQTKINIQVDLSLNLLEKFREGELDAIITTECHGTGKLLKTLNLNWFIYPDSEASQLRPLPIATCNNCAFTKPVSKILDDSTLDYEFLPNINTPAVSRALAMSGLAVKIDFEEADDVKGFEILKDPDLPKLPDFGIYLYQNGARISTATNDLAKIVGNVYQG